MSNATQKAIGSTPSHTRMNDTLITRYEKKALLWLAARMPAWVMPDTLTALGLFGSLLIFAGYALTIYDSRFLWLSSLGFVINWFGDSLDGTLARYRHIERPRYGFFIDHITDAISEILIFIGLGLSPYLRFDLAMLALVTYMLASTAVFLITYVNGVFRISYGGISPTEIRLIAILANTVVLIFGNPSVPLARIGSLPIPATISLYDLVVLVVMLIILSLFVVVVINVATSLSQEDRTASQIQKAQKRAAARASKRQARSRKDLQKQGRRLNQPSVR